MPPSRETSPTITTSRKTADGMSPSAARMPTAMGRSKAAPSLRRSAGARLTVILRWGKLKPLLRSAERTRSRLSRTVRSGSPTTVNMGNPAARSTSTSTE